MKGCIAVALLAGIDEAGFGPLLGPLVVCSTAVRLPDERLGGDLWDLLQGAVCRSRRRQGGRLLVTDSKKAYARSTGLGPMQRTVLALLSLEGAVPTSVEEACERLCPGLPGRLARYPWYGELAAARFDENRLALEVAAHALARQSAQQGLRWVPPRVRCLDVWTYNRHVAAVRNKSRVLWIAASSLIQDLWAGGDEERIEIVLDRQGGRQHYRSLLQQSFPDLEMHVLQEDEQLSRYRMSRDGRHMTLHFQVKAEGQALCVALASMVAKWLREVLMGQLNRYWTERCPGLAPTAGYWQDGSRFVQQLRERMGRFDFDERLLIRCR